MECSAGSIIQANLALKKKKKKDRKKALRTCFYLEWRISIGKVVDYCQGLLEPGASNPSVRYQLAHSLDDLRQKTRGDHQSHVDTPPRLHRAATDLQVGADDGLSLGELKVFPHEKVEQRRCLRLGGAGAVVAALEDLVAQAAAQVRLALEERAGELRTGGAAAAAAVRLESRDAS